NQLVQVSGTPLADREAAPAGVDGFEFVRTIAVARILMPQAQVRLSAGREAMSDELQALAFLAGANSIFYGEKLLTTGNPEVERDRALRSRLGMESETQQQTDARGCGWRPWRVFAAAHLTRRSGNEAQGRGDRGGPAAACPARRAARAPRG